MDTARRQVGTGELVESKISALRRKSVTSGLTLPVQFVCRLCSCVNRSGQTRDGLALGGYTFTPVSGILPGPLAMPLASTMMKGFYAVDANEYMAKLLCGRSSNGVFGLNARFEDFASVVRYRSS
jgi:hypothetical protein